MTIRITSDLWLLKNPLIIKIPIRIIDTSWSTAHRPSISAPSGTVRGPERSGRRGGLWMLWMLWGRPKEDGDSLFVVERWKDGYEIFRFIPFLSCFIMFYPIFSPVNVIKKWWINGFEKPMESPGAHLVMCILHIFRYNLINKRYWPIPKYIRYYSHYPNYNPH